MADTCCNHNCNQGRDCPRSLDASRLALGLRALHTEDGGSWVTGGHRVLRLRPGEVGPTGREPQMLQDADRGLSKWLASKPDARLHAREAAAAIRRERAPSESATARSDALGRALLVIAVAAALAAVLSPFNPF